MYYYHFNFADTHMYAQEFLHTVGFSGYNDSQVTTCCHHSEKCDQTQRAQELAEDQSLYFQKEMAKRGRGGGDTEAFWQHSKHNHVSQPKLKSKTMPTGFRTHTSRVSLCDTQK